MAFRTTLIAAAFALGLSACTEQQNAKAYGGKMTVELPTGRKLENITWKNNDMWILTRPARPGEVPETHKFSESSDFGVWQGEITIVEK
jgi:hypothetical protein